MENEKKEEIKSEENQQTKKLCKNLTLTVCLQGEIDLFLKRIEKD